MTTRLGIASIRRYPVKSMGGEALTEARIDDRGIVGDRGYAVVDDDGKLASGKNTKRFRRRDEVFDYHAETRDDGVWVHRDQRHWPVGDAALDAELSQAMNGAVRVRPEGDVAHQDSADVSLIGSATLEWCDRRWGVNADPRRLRVNIVLQTAEPFVEETWVGARLFVGSAELEVTERLPRCRMIDLDQDGAAAVKGWLRPLGAERDACLAIAAAVRSPGALAVGDVVTVG